LKKFLDQKYQKNYWENNANARGYKHPVVKFFVKQRIDWLKQFIDLKEIKSAYDVGCGDGFATYYLDKEVENVRGGDIAQHMLDMNPLPSSRLDIIDAENLPLKDNSYDLVYTWEVLHHVPDPQKAVTEMARTSSNYVVIYEPNRNNVLQFLFGLLNKQERGTLRSTKKYLTKLCSNAGLEVVDASYCGKIPPNKTPEILFPIMKRLSFKSTFLTGISICIVAKKPDSTSII
jgi:ubiquinone/menaquinone biosynthesis C-methylase UbiE